MLGRLVTATRRLIGLALAVLVDATVIRGREPVAPGPLRRLHERIGMREDAACFQPAGIRGG